MNFYNKAGWHVDEDWVRFGLRCLGCTGWACMLAEHTTACSRLYFFSVWGQRIGFVSGFSLLINCVIIPSPVLSNPVSACCYYIKMHAIIFISCNDQIWLTSFSRFSGKKIHGISEYRTTLLHLSFYSWCCHSCFPVAVMKHHDQGQCTEGRVYLGFRF